LDLLELDFEVRFLACHFLAMVIGGKVHIERSAFPGLHTDKVLLEVGEQLSAAKHRSLIGAGAALERLACNGSAIVHADLVASLRATLDRVKMCALFAQDFDSLIHFGIIDTHQGSLD